MALAMKSGNKEMGIRSAQRCLNNKFSHPFRLHVIYNLVAFSIRVRRKEKKYHVTDDWWGGGGNNVALRQGSLSGYITRLVLGHHC